MVKVPVAPGRNVQVQPLENRAFQYSRARDMSSGAIDRLGEQVTGFANGLQDLANRRSEYDAKDGALAFGGEIDRLINNPETGLFRLQGKDAVDAYEPVLQELDASAKRLASERKSPLAARMFEDNASARLEALRKQVGAFVVRERQVYEDETDRAMVSSELADAGRAWEDDEQVEVHIATAAAVFARMANRGRSLEWGQDQMERAESGARRDVALARIMNIGPEAGQAYYEKHVDTFTPDDARAVQNAVRVRQAAIEAEQRRVEAEKRAAESLQRRESKEQLDTLRVSLETGAGDSGDWEALATGYADIGDASAAQQARIRGAEVKAVEKYRGSSLTEIDERLNELDAITGRRALTPAEAAERNGLRSHRQQTESRLNQPGGLMAQMQTATGQPVTPLTDDASYQRRAGQAAASARRYGRFEVQPLTEAEIPGLRDLVATGSQGRMKALETIAKFRDPKAIKGAAAQIATKEDGAFRIAATLMGLPGGTSVARDVLRGVDAEKTNGSVFQVQQARLLFNRHVGPALAATPDYASDVFDAARSFYIARMTQHGKTGWSDDAWNTAVESVLGGTRNANGVMTGGFTRIHGVPVVLPSGWTNEGLARRVSRATGPQWSAASVNGNPVWPDGSPVYSAQLRNMVPVRVGDTLYAFRDRAEPGLIQSKSKPGQPFTVDVAKLPWQ